jgi:hypothetical protein
MPVSPISVLPSVFALGFTVVDEVRKARKRDSDGGRKITRQEWSQIVSRACASLSVGLTNVFAEELEDDAIDTFSGDRPSQIA